MFNHRKLTDPNRYVIIKPSPDMRGFDDGFHRDQLDAGSSENR